MIGGFLGAGKTTAMLRFAEALGKRGLRVGLITNDQADGLVDTALIRSRGFAVEEIAGGCFCCRFNSLKQAADQLDEQSRPDVLLAEPVGSCTDLIATVSYPLRRIYGDLFEIAPLPVLVDPQRALRVFGRSEGKRFSEKVCYIYTKQLEEADHIVVNKCELLDGPEREVLSFELERRFPQTPVFWISARGGEGCEPWFDRLLESQLGDKPAMKLDYDLYADGEAQLGWLNATYSLSSNMEVDADEFLSGAAQNISREIRLRQMEIAHLKMTLQPDDASGEIASIHQVGSDRIPELGLHLLDPFTRATLIVNLRAEGRPADLRECVQLGLSANSIPGCRVTLDHMDHFQPGRPVPTHRDPGGG